MMRWIVATSLRFRFVVLAVAAIVMVIGFGQLRGVPVDVFPDLSAPAVTVLTEATGWRSRTPGPREGGRARSRSATRSSARSSTRPRHWPAGAASAGAYASPRYPCSAVGLIKFMVKA